MAASDRRPIFSYPLLLLTGVAFAGGCNGAPIEPKAGAGVLELQMPGKTTLDRPAVSFDHTSHTSALVVDDNYLDTCTTCHQRGGDGHLLPGVISQDAREHGAALDSEEAMNAYHRLCIGCHRKRAKTASKTGPQACGECHARRPPLMTVRRPMRYDYSMHARHTLALGDRCNECHHTFDETLKKLVYKKGAEAACSDCHRDRDEGKKLSLRHASHEACVACHAARKARELKTGPVRCEGCHDPVRQRGFARLAQIPRLKREGQKDDELLQTEGTKMPAVPFDHKAHEPRVAFCSSCHHEKLEDCNKCHTLAPATKGGGVHLEQAFHQPSSKRSCVGCHHQRATSDRDCAGCHQQVGTPPRPLGCQRCHSGAALAASQPSVTPASRPLVTAASQAVVAASQPAVQRVQLSPLPATGDDYPETVVIRSLEKKYDPSVLPHQRIVARLDAVVRKSELARHFHGATETLCAGCHHHSPVGGRPPSCRSCHGEQPAPAKDKPRLLAAYHRQCIGCHQTMKIKAVGCTDCHAAKPASAGNAKSAAAKATAQRTTIAAGSR